MEPFYLLIPLFFLTALLYASVGFAGGSTYLALLVLFQVPYPAIPQTALLCNLAVAGGGLYHYHQGGHLPLRAVFPFVLASIPFAWFGGRVPVSKDVFLLLLGFSLLFAGLRLLFVRKPSADARSRRGGNIWIPGLCAGAPLGFLSGLVGIGGGIFLAPLLYFLKWGSPRQIAAASSFFIFVNSAAGFFGQWAKNPAEARLSLLWPLLAAVILGGQIGSRVSVGRLSPIGLQRGTAVVVLSVAARIFWGLL